MSIIGSEPPSRYGWDALEHPHASKKMVIHALEIDAIAGLRDGNAENFLKLLLHPVMSEQNTLFPQMLREWLIGFLEGGPEFGYRLTLVRHPELKHNPKPQSERDAESSKGIEAVVAFLNGGGLESYKRGIHEAMEATGWSRTKTTNWIGREKIAAMRLAVECPQLDLDPVAAGLGLKLRRQKPMKWTESSE
jgi:hypothetical protein